MIQSFSKVRCMNAVEARTVMTCILRYLTHRSRYQVSSQSQNTHTLLCLRFLTTMNMTYALRSDHTSPRSFIFISCIFNALVFASSHPLFGFASVFAKMNTQAFFKKSDGPSTKKIAKTAPKKSPPKKSPPKRSPPPPSKPAPAKRVVSKPRPTSSASLKTKGWLGGQGGVSNLDKWYGEYTSDLSLHSARQRRW